MEIFVLAFAIKDDNEDVSSEIIERLFLSMASAHDFAQAYIQEYKAGYVLNQIGHSKHNLGRGYIGSSSDEDNEDYFDSHFTLNYSIQQFDIGDP